MERTIGVTIDDLIFFSMHCSKGAIATMGAWKRSGFTIQATKRKDCLENWSKGGGCRLSQDEPLPLIYDTLFIF